MNEERLLRWVSNNDTRYHPNAYYFVLEALRYTQQRFKKPRHVSGQELLVGLTCLARERYSDLALMVFEEWGTTTGRDFGNIVFNLVELGEIKKTDDDCIEDFDSGYDFHTEFGQANVAS